MAPGTYEVKAMMSQGGKTAVQQVAFTVPGDGSVAARHRDMAAKA